MTTSAQRRDDIYDQLVVVCDVANKGYVESDLRALAGRLVPHHSRALFDKITWLPSQHGWCASDLEGLLMPRTNVATSSVGGKNPPDEAFVARAEREAVVGGQSIAKAKAGAELMRKAREAADKLRLERERLHKKGPAPVAPIAAPPQKEAKAKALAALEDFGKDPLDGLDSF